jgi:hypothetical protein
MTCKLIYHEEKMNANSKTQTPSTTWPASLAGIALFVLWGLMLITEEFPHEWAVPAWVQGFLIGGILALLPVGLCIGWIKSFPRWSYPYVGHVLIFSLYMVQVATPGLRVFGYSLFGRELWGWRAWIPFLVVAAVALAVTRSLRPLAKLFTNIWNDWTLLTFGMFGFMPLVIFIGFDEVDRLYSLYFMVILGLLMPAMALLYMRGSHPWQRTMALLIGILLTTAITAVAPTLYWQENGWVLPLQVAIAGVILVLFMFSPALIGLLHHAIVTRRRVGAA